MDTINSELIADVCTPESHARDKAERAPTLRFAGVQLDEDGRVELVYLHCCRCESTLASDDPELLAGAREDLAA